MSNVAPTPRDPREKNFSGIAVKRSRLLRVLLWVAASIVLAAVFLGYQQVDLAIAWITAKLC